jgi:hypothetical protein
LRRDGCRGWRSQWRGRGGRRRRRLRDREATCQHHHTRHRSCAHDGYGIAVSSDTTPSRAPDQLAPRHRAARGYYNAGLRKTSISLGLLAVAASAAAADPAPQLQADLGLAVIDVAYEHPIGGHESVGVEAGIFGTYFLPWFSAGDAATGAGGGVRASWFSGSEGRGLYVTPFFRAADVAANGHTGLALSGGAFAGYAFALTHRLDLRVGAGLQYIHYDFAGTRASTPFVALDLVVGYRL